MVASHFHHFSLHFHLSSSRLMKLCKSLITALCSAIYEDEDIQISMEINLLSKCSVCAVHHNRVKSADTMLTLLPVVRKLARFVVTKPGIFWNPPPLLCTYYFTYWFVFYISIERFQSWCFPRWIILFSRSDRCLIKRCNRKSSEKRAFWARFHQQSRK